MSYQVECPHCDGGCVYNDKTGEAEVCHICEGNGVIIELDKEDRRAIAMEDRRDADMQDNL